MGGHSGYLTLSQRKLYVHRSRSTCMDLELTPTDSDVSVTVSTDRISTELGEQGILNEDEASPEFFYLAALALETRSNSQYDIEDSIMEFLRNSSAVSVDMNECNEIESILR